MSGPGERKVVLHPQTAASRQLGRARARGGFVRGHKVDEAALESLIKSQRRLITRTGLMLAIPIAALPTVLATWPSISRASIWGLPPMGWLILGPIVLPLFAFLGKWHEHKSGQVEDRWSEQNQ